jgi:hypothetical protein
MKDDSFEKYSERLMIMPIVYVQHNISQKSCNKQKNT